MNAGSRILRCSCSRSIRVSASRQQFPYVAGASQFVFWDAALLFHPLVVTYTWVGYAVIRSKR